MFSSNVLDCRRRCLARACVVGAFEWSGTRARTLNWGYGGEAQMHANKEENRNHQEYLISDRRRQADEAARDEYLESAEKGTSGGLSHERRLDQVGKLARMERENQDYVRKNNLEIFQRRKTAADNSIECVVGDSVQFRYESDPGNLKVLGAEVDSEIDGVIQSFIDFGQSAVVQRTTHSLVRQVMLPTRFKPGRQIYYLKNSHPGREWGTGDVGDPIAQFANIKSLEYEFEQITGNPLTIGSDYWLVLMSPSEIALLLDVEANDYITAIGDDDEEVRNNKQLPWPLKRPEPGQVYGLKISKIPRTVPTGSLRKILENNIAGTCQPELSNPPVQCVEGEGIKYKENNVWSDGTIEEFLGSNRSHASVDKHQGKVGRTALLSRMKVKDLWSRDQKAFCKESGKE